MGNRIGLAVVCGGLVAALAGTASAADVVINEVDYDQPSTDAAEFIELKNTTTAAIDLSGYSVVLINGGVATPAPYRTITFPAATSLAAGDYYVICANPANTPNCDLDASPDTGWIQNGDPDAIVLYNGATPVDVLSYGGDTAGGFFEGSGLGLKDNALPSQGISRFPDGVDTDVNNVDFSIRCLTPGASNGAANSLCECGDGNVDAGESCDDGVTNGTTSCGCQTNCKFATTATTCGSSAATECTAPDTCDGAGACNSNDEVDGTVCNDGDASDCTGLCAAGACTAAQLPTGSACGDATDNACNGADTCDAAGVCQANLASAGAVCGSNVATACTAPDTCDGAGVCESHDAPINTPCGSATDDVCTNPDFCSGTGVCLRNDAANGTVCDDGDGNACTGTCLVGECLALNRPAGASCGDPRNDACTDPDTCNGGGACLTNHAANGTTCADDTFCNGNEMCQSGQCVLGMQPCGAGETCDDITNMCLTAPCGNGIVEGNEECDDANARDDDGCTACVIDAGFACGDEPSDCNETCGNGALDEFEQCDDGNTADDDGCDPSCRPEEGWQCAGTDPCTPDCGDGRLLGDEACDDGNDTSGDGCTACVVDTEWQCDTQEPTVCAPLATDDGGCSSSRFPSLGFLLLLAWWARSLYLRRRCPRLIA